MIDGLNILPCRANWASPVTIRSMFATNTKRESAPGLYSRDSGRDFGQRKISFALMPYDDMRRQWDAFREVNPPGTVIGVPLWHEEGTYLTADAAMGATSLSVAGADFIDWRTEAVLWHQPDPSMPAVIEGVTLSDVTGSTFTLATGTATAFAAGDQVLPLMRGYQLDDFNEDAASAEISSVNVTFVEDLAHITAFTIGGLPDAVTYLGLPVLPFMAEWSTAPKFGIGRGTHLAASGLNAQALATLRTYVRQSISQQVGLDGRQDRAVLWKFFHDRRGRFSRFWLPALKDELKLAVNAGASDTALTLANYSDFVSRYQLGGDLRRAIFITDGFNFWIRQVSNLSGGTNAVTIDAALGTAVSADACQIGLLTLAQFAHDDIEIDCQSPTVATASLSFMELEHEYSEVITSGTTNGSRSGMELVTA